MHSIINSKNSVDGGGGGDDDEKDDGNNGGDVQGQP